MRLCCNDVTFFFAMGLAEPKKKRKLELDPRNTQWANNTSSIGRKLMASMGWKPGEGLGVDSAGSVTATDMLARAIIPDQDSRPGIGLESALEKKDRWEGTESLQGIYNRLNKEIRGKTEEGKVSKKLKTSKKKIKRKVKIRKTDEAVEMNVASETTNEAKEQLPTPPSRPSSSLRYVIFAFATR